MHVVMFVCACCFASVFMFIVHFLSVTIAVPVIHHHRIHYLMSLFLIYDYVHVNRNSQSCSVVRKHKEEIYIVWKKQSMPCVNLLHSKNTKNRYFSFNLPHQTDIWLSKFARFACKTTSIALHVRTHYHLIAGSTFFFFGQLYYVAYEWTYIDTHVNLCINFLEGFFFGCGDCLVFWDFEITIRINELTTLWIRALFFFDFFFISLLNYSVWRSFFYDTFCDFMFFLFSLLFRHARFH